MIYLPIRDKEFSILQYSDICWFTKMTVITTWNHTRAHNQVRRAGTHWKSEHLNKYKDIIASLIVYEYISMLHVFR